MTSKRYLIVNADDFGRSEGINRGVIHAHENGIVTSASLMVRWPAAVQAAAYARSHARLGLGLHLDLCEWVYEGDAWIAVYEVVPLEDKEAVEVEVERQLSSFQDLVGRPPTHIDSHQHVHRHEPISSVVSGVARRLNVPVRHAQPTVRYCGDFFGQSGHAESLHELIGVRNLVTILRTLPPGVTELACHPGDGADFDSPYDSERRLEMETLCDPEVRVVLAEEGIHLWTFGHLQHGQLVSG